MGVESSRIARLAADLEAGERNALDAFWREVETAGAPLVEPVEGEPSWRLVTFVWRDRAGDAENVVVLWGPAPFWDVPSNVLRRLPGSDLWYKTYRVRSDHRGRYVFAQDDPLSPLPREGTEESWARYRTFVADPFNSRVHVVPRNALDPHGIDRSFSVLELPDAPPQRWAQPRQGVPRGRVEQYALPIPICDAADTYDTDAVLVDVDLDVTDVEALNTLHLRPPSAVRYRLAEGTRLDWIVRDATNDEWRIDVSAGEAPELPAGAGYVLHRMDPATGAFAMEPAPSYDEALRLAAVFAEHGFPAAAEQVHGFGNPYPELVQVSAVRYISTGVEVIANDIAEARRTFVSTPKASYIASVVTGERIQPEPTGWMLFGLTALPEN